MHKKNTKSILKKKNIEIVNDTKPKKKITKPQQEEKEKELNDKIYKEDKINNNDEDKEDKEEDKEESISDEIIEDNDDDDFNDDKNEIDDEDKEIDSDNSKDSKSEESESDDDDNVNLGDDKEDKVADYDDDKCLYNFVDDKSDEEIELIFDDDIIPEISDVIPPEKRKSKPFLFKYERVRLLGDRTQQLTLGAKPMIKNTENLTPKQIAELELQNNVIPLIIQRPLPNGKKERWYINELAH